MLLPAPPPQTAADHLYLPLTHLLPVGLASSRRHARRRHADLLCRPELDRYVGGLDLLNVTVQISASTSWSPLAKFTTVRGNHPGYRSLRRVGHYTTIFEGINKLISYVAPRSRLCFC